MLKKINKILESVSQVLEFPSPKNIDKNHWAIPIDAKSILNAVYEEEDESIVLYISLFEKIPQAPHHLSTLHHSVQNRETQFGSIGIDTEQKRIHFYKQLSLKDANESYLTIFIPSFIQSAINCKHLMIKASQTPLADPMQQPSQQPIQVKTKTKELS
jgi:hypothetical protein